jgi:hypothetical protein
MTVLAVAVAVLTGFLLVRLAWPNGLRVCRHDIFRLSLGAGAGLAISSVVVFAANAAAGGRSRSWLIGADLLILSGLAAAYWLRRRHSPCPFCARPAVPAHGLFVLVAALATLLSIGAFAMASAINPHGEWDAFAIWNNHARFLASGPQWTRMFAPELAWSVPDYPLLVPGAIAGTWVFAGSQSVLGPMLVAACFLLATAGVLYGAVEILRGKPQALLAVTVLFGAPALVRMSASQYADVPLAFFYLATAALLCIAGEFPHDVHPWWLAALTGAAAAWTKNEGLVFLAVVFAVQTFGVWKWSPSGLRKRFPWMCAGALPLVAILVWFKTGFAPPNYLFTEQKPLGERIGDFSRYVTVAVECGKQLFTLGGWLVPPVLVAVAYLWLVGRSKHSPPERKLVVAILLLMTLAYAGVYVITTKDLQWQLETSLSRVFMQLWPLAVFAFFLYARAPLQAASSPPAPAAGGARRTRKRVAR